MNLLESVPIALASLGVHKLRSGLTALGIIIGTAATVLMLAVGAGARAHVAAQVRSLGSNLLVVVPGNINQSGVRLGSGTTPTLTDDDAAAIAREIASVQVASPLINGRVQIVADAANWATTIYATEPSFFEARDWSVTSGTEFGREESTGGAQVVLLGQTVTRQMFAEEEPIGREVRIRNVPFRIIGILAKKGQTTTGQDQDDAVIVPMTSGRRVLGRNQAKSLSINAILVKVREGESLTDTSQEVQALLRQRHRRDSLQDDDFVVRNLSAVSDVKEAGARTLSVLLASVAMVSLATGGIGILNIMLVSVTERTKEIGIRMAVGARRKDILLQFLFEAIGLSLFGGLAGVILGIGGSFLMAEIGDWPLMIDPLSLGLAAGSSLVVGVFFGWYPARKASKLAPIEAIRTV